MQLFDRVQRNSGGSLLAYFKAGFCSISPKAPYGGILLAERTSDEETSAVISINAKIPGKRLVCHRHFYVNCLSPASAFRHQGHSGTAGHGLVRHCPAMFLQRYVDIQMIQYSTSAHCTLHWNLYMRQKLKVPKCEIFDPFFFTSVNPIWVGELRTGEKKILVRRLRQIFAILVFCAC
jgi:hypothetical protein